MSQGLKTSTNIQRTRKVCTSVGNLRLAFVQVLLVLVLVLELNSVVTVANTNTCDRMTVANGVRAARNVLGGKMGRQH